MEHSRVTWQGMTSLRRCYFRHGRNIWHTVSGANFMGSSLRLNASMIERHFSLRGKALWFQRLPSQTAESELLLTTIWKLQRMDIAI